MFHQCSVPGTDPPESPQKGLASWEILTGVRLRVTLRRGERPKNQPFIDAIMKGHKNPMLLCFIILGSKARTSNHLLFSPCQIVFAIMCPIENFWKTVVLLLRKMHNYTHTEFSHRIRGPIIFYMCSFIVYRGIQFSANCGWVQNMVLECLYMSKSSRLI